ncbi:MAG: SDR family oxidoreductase [Bacteroidetes bacterium]|nr:SDR family oxidoreductase [Bacteroidota bacterium]
MTLEGKTALITGASGGIGRAIAILLAQRGARVILHYNRDRESAEGTAAKLEGNKHRTLKADLSDPAECQMLVTEARTVAGRLDITVNNAGYFSPHPPATVSFEQWREAWTETIGVNLLGAAHVAYWSAQEMIKTDGGRIINISSRGAFRGEPDAPAYGASKAGMNAMSQSMAKALAPHNILVFAVAPGWVETRMALSLMAGPEAEEIRNQSPFKRIATPDEIARVALFLATDAPAFMSGCIVDVNGASYLRT